jgi:hypothetical protein
MEGDRRIAIELAIFVLATENWRARMKQMYFLYLNPLL